MSHDERYGTRDLTFSRWHRYALPDRATALDLDMYEYCRVCRTPLCLIETARDVGQAGKATIGMAELARSADVPAICVLYTPDGACRCEWRRKVPGCHHGITRARVRGVFPVDEPFELWQACDLAAWLTMLHDAHEETTCPGRIPSPGCAPGSRARFTGLAP